MKTFCLKKMQQTCSFRRNNLLSLAEIDLYIDMNKRNECAFIWNAWRNTVSFQYSYKFIVSMTWSPFPYGLDSIKFAFIFSRIRSNRFFPLKLGLGYRKTLKWKSSAAIRFWHLRKFHYSVSVATVSLWIKWLKIRKKVQQMMFHVPFRLLFVFRFITWDRISRACR